MKVFPLMNQSCDDPLLQCVQQVYQVMQLAMDERWCATFETEQQAWLSFRRLSEHLPTQGWKLHLTADLASAPTVLKRVLPFLLQETAAFKFASTLEQLRQLNRGEKGQSQVGKFVTIYPRDADEAVRLAVKLDDMTRGLSGPCVPSDRMLRPGSLVFYRYGGYDGSASVQDLLGQVWPAMRTPDNQLLPDKRLLSYQAPTYWEDPFLKAGIASELPRPERLLVQRYLIVSVIASSINHTISLAIDLTSQQMCIVKGPGRSWQNALPEIERVPFRREARALCELAGCTRIPTLLDLHEKEQDIFLVVSDIRGQVLMERLARERLFNLCPLSQVITWGKELAEMLHAIHIRGYVYADLKPTNIIIDPDERLHLIDFELADRQGVEGIARQGTPGYMSPQQFAGEPRAITDDVYSYGALLYLLVTGVEPSLAPDPFALLLRPLELLRSDIPLTLKEIITRCLALRPDERYATMHEVLAALANVRAEPEHIVCPGQEMSNNEQQESARAVAIKLRQTLCVEAREAAGGEGRTWRTTHPIANNYALRDLNVGLAGTVLALAGLVAELPEAGASHLLEKSARWLCQTPPHSDPPLPGLYVGEAGVGAALLLAGQVLEDQALVDAAIAQGRRIAGLPHVSPDVMHGSAGRLLFHLLLWDETGEEEHRAAALACGEHLLRTMQTREPGEVCWTLPADFQVFSSAAYPGYAHGVAGIADALLELFEATGSEHLVPVIQGAARWLQRLAIPVLADNSGLGWPVTEDQSTPSYPFWCHGSAGVGRFFLRASRFAWVPGAREMAIRAARAVIHLGKMGGPTLCHGLAGSCEFLLDMYQETGEQFYLGEAQIFARLLDAFASQRAGTLVFHSDQVGVFSPDYLVGYAGIASCFVRLSAPSRLPALLSRAGFRTAQRQARGAETKEALSVTRR